MNNRNDEFLELCNEMQDISMPDKLNNMHTAKKLRRRAAAHYTGVAVKGLCALAVVFLMTLFIGVNASEAFAKECGGIPVLSTLARIFEVNRGLQDVFFAEYAVNVAETDEFTADGTRYEVELSYAAGDDTSLVMFLTATAEGGHAKDAEIMIDGAKVYDCDTGEQVELDGFIGTTLQNGSDRYSCMAGWSEYHKNIRVMLSVYSVSCPSEGSDDTISGGYRRVFEDASENGLQSGGEKPCLCYSFTLNDKDEPMICEVNETFLAGGEEFRIGEVRVYPLSTEVELSKPDGLSIVSIELSLTDEAGKVKREQANTMTSAHGSSALLAVGSTYIFQSGYYAFDDEMFLRVGKIEMLHDDLKEVVLDLETGSVTDPHGAVPGVTYDREKNVLNIQHDFAWTYQQAYRIHYPDGLYSWSGYSVSETEYEYRLPEELLQPIQGEDSPFADGKVRLEREYPEMYENVECLMRIK